MKPFLLSALALLVSSPAYAQGPSADIGRWDITKGTAALTGVRSITATLPSSNSLANMLGYPTRAKLVAHCGEAGLDFYVAWSQVLSQDSTNFLGQPKTMAAWRIDDGKIKTNLWDIDSSGTAAGEFKQNSAARLVSTMIGAKTLTVRLRGFQQQAQDSTFELAGLDTVVTEVASACGVKLGK